MFSPADKGQFKLTEGFVTKDLRKVRNFSLKTS
ncbi:MAG: hypothetical protein S4CHLAM2_14650 [Chlamydiales bacterium]|nr:hypothetical protein [Chlamydiales bacterium]